ETVAEGALDADAAGFAFGVDDDAKDDLATDVVALRGGGEVDVGVVRDGGRGDEGVVLAAGEGAGAVGAEAEVGRAGDVDGLRREVVRRPGEERVEVVAPEVGQGALEGGVYALGEDGVEGV